MREEHTHTHTHTLKLGESVWARNAADICRQVKTRCQEIKCYSVGAIDGERENEFTVCLRVASGDERKERRERESESEAGKKKEEVRCLEMR